jgi:hypothetical protein
MQAAYVFLEPLSCILPIYNWMEITTESHKAASIRTTSFLIPLYVTLRHLESNSWYVCNDIQHFIATIAVLSTAHSSYSEFSRFESCLMSPVSLLRSCIQSLWVNMATALYNSSWRFPTTSFVVQCQLQWMIKQNFSVTYKNLCRTYRFNPEFTDWSKIRISLTNSR